MRVVSCLLSFVLVLSAFGAAAAQDDVPAGRIAFASDRSDVYQIYTMRGDGSDVTQITDGPFDAFLPIWSPDGTKLTYLESTGDAALSERPAIRLMLMDADGGNATEITRDPDNGIIMNPNWYLDWSPDSAHLHYGLLVAEGEDQHIEQYVFNVATGDTIRITSPSEEDDLQFVRFWGHDHLMLSLRDGLYRASLDGSDAQLMVADAYAPAALSPDLTQIATVGGDELTVVGADGALRQVVVESMSGPVDGTRVTYAYHLRWSPDGTWISGAVRLVSASWPDVTSGPGEALFVVRADGTDYASFTAADLLMRWSPDSRHLAYTVNDDEDNVQVVVADADGSNIRVLTEGSNNVQPAWEPA